MLVRSYSPICGTSWLDADTDTCGRRCRQVAHCRRSFAGLMCALMKHTAIASHALALDARRRSPPARSRSSGSSMLPSRIAALGHLEAQAALDQRLRLAEFEVIEPRRAKAPELEHVAESARRDERDCRAACAR